MERSSRFFGLVALQLMVPAVVYLLLGLINGRTDLEHLLPNYLYMGAPHLLVAATAFWPKARVSAVLWLLTLLNVLLVGFLAWVQLAVPTNESGLAWLLYLPLWASVLAASAIAWVVVRYSGPSKAGAPGNRVGT